MRSAFGGNRVKNALATSVLTLLAIQQVYAQEVGIDFESMPVGTTLVTETHGSRPVRLSERYLGKRENFFVTEETRLKKDGEWQFHSTTYYDLEGRLVRRDLTKGFIEYKPWSCHYVLGECEHAYQYPNPFKQYKQTKNTQKFTTRLENDTLIVSWTLIDGRIAEAPFKLGPYNLRVSSEYKNRLGEDTGYKFIDLVVPGEKASADPGGEQPNDVAAQATSGDKCTVLYEQLAAEAPGDIGSCTPVIKRARFDQCTLPSNAEAMRLPSQVVMILDASGSMAGNAGGTRKMLAAKREARKFMAALAKDVPVGLIVYGHKGNNDESGKLESCAGIEWALPGGRGPGTPRNGVANRRQCDRL
jgi:hypothetical protein